MEVTTPWLQGAYRASEKKMVALKGEKKDAKTPACLGKSPD